MKFGSRQPAAKGVLFWLLAGIILFAPASSALASDEQERHNVILSDDAWIDSVDTLLYSDRDVDGYFSGLRLSIDADSVRSSIEVYATVDIINEANVLEPLLTTRPFYLYRRSHTDEYRLDIDLVRNYPSGIFDLEISLFDARSDRFLDRVGPRDIKNLRALPLESEDYDFDNAPQVSRPPPSQNSNVVVAEYAGNAGAGFLLLLALTGLFRRRQPAR